MDNANFIVLNDMEQFELSFKYVNKEVNVDKVFTYKKQLCETVSTLLRDISNSITGFLKKTTKIAEGIQTLVKILLSIDKLEVPVLRGMFCYDIVQYGNNNLLLRINDTYYNLNITAPLKAVINITLPISICENCPVYPIKSQSVSMDKDECEFTWLKSIDRKNWTIIDNNYIFTPSTQEVDHYLKLVLTLEGSTFEIVSAKTVKRKLENCPIELRHQFTKKKTKGKEFRVVSYNTLSAVYCERNANYIYNYCPAYALKKNYRKQLLLREIIGYNADLICLQELDIDVFERDIQPILRYFGYGSDFLNKKNLTEGTAFFFNKTRFKHLHKERFVFCERVNTDPLFADIWDKINVVQSLEYEEILVVGNTHFPPFPDSGPIRIVHAEMAIKYLEIFIDKLKAKYSGKRISLIFCGDFNSNPSTDVYQFYTTRGASRNLQENNNSISMGESLEINHHFQLASACGTPNYTNYAASFFDCLDYIFYEESNLVVSQVVPLPSHEAVTRCTALPSIFFPSDHLSLVADLKWL